MSVSRTPLRQGDRGLRAAALATLAALAAWAALAAAPAPGAAGARGAAEEPAPAPIRHALEVRLDPSTHRVTVNDTITMPEGGREVEFLLNGRLDLVGSTPEATEVPLGDVAPFFGINAAPDGIARIPHKRYRASLPRGETTVKLLYEGRFDFGLSDPKEEYTRGFRDTIGIVGADGVYLAGGGFWYPHFGSGLISFDMTVASLPEGWHVISQGRGSSRDAAGAARWESEGPMDEIYLVGGPLRRYHEQAGPVETDVYLRVQDDGLAGKYLGVTAQYLKMYGDLIGPYPYSKFALVENFWETGYGMPSFTLLGPQVIRFPFILHSSYPHEILHNWWGNSVFVDYATGNWCEGLTAYMADHLVQEQRGKGDEHRRAALQKYRDYVKTERDFPLGAFRSRHSAATEAVGYGKTMMGFHMLRRRLGDDAFRAWASRFNNDYRGRQASFHDIRASMEAVSEQDLARFFEDWVGRAGAAELAVEGASVKPLEDGFEVTGRLRQAQADAPFLLEVPVVVQTESAPVEASVRLEGREAAFAIKSPGRPLALHVDPAFDLFRRLDPRETPASIGRIFGEPRVVAVLASSAPESEQDAYRSMAEGWRSEGHEVEVVSDADLAALPADRAVWLLGAGNRFAGKLALPEGEASLDETQLRAGGEAMSRSGHSFVLTARHPSDAARAIGWIVADPPAALPGLGRKLPHYGKYSYLGFEGTEPVNVLKGQWSASDSPLRVDLRAGAGRADAPPALALSTRRPLAELPPVFSVAKLREHVGYLASPDRQGRGLGSEGLEVAAAYIARQFESLGLAPGGDAGTYFQRFTATGTPDRKPREAANVIGVLAGSRPDWAGQSVVVGAHYDHLGLGWPDAHAGDEGKVHPGADDNASGVAVMLELARDLASAERPQRSIVFVAFTGEEAGRLGSRHYVEHPVFPNEGAIGMVNLDTVGRLGTGRLSVLATGTAAEWQHIFRGAGYVTGVDSRIIAESYESSDQKSFIDRGVPAVQLFTAPHADYHRPGDTAGKVDVDGLVKVASFVKEAVAYLAERSEPMTVTIPRGPAAAPGASHPAGPVAPGGASSGRRVSLGTVPDFGFPGPGVKVAGIVAGSPAEAAGLKEGDILVRLAGSEVVSLKAYSDLLKTLSAGRTVDVVVLREGAHVTLQATLAAR